MIDQLAELIREQINKIHIVHPAKVVSVNKADCTVTVEVLGATLTTLKNAKNSNYPRIIDIPIVFPVGYDMAFTIPVKPGNLGLLIFSMNSIEPFYYGIKIENADYATSNFNNAFFIPSMRTKETKLDAYDYDDYLSLRSIDNNTHIRLKPDEMDFKVKESKVLGNSTITGNTTQTGNIKLTGNIDQKGNYKILGSTTQTGNIQVSGAVSSTLTVTAGVSVSSPLVAGAVVTAGGVDVGAKLKQHDADIAQIKARLSAGGL